jgi:hypothetical protein
MNCQNSDDQKLFQCDRFNHSLKKIRLIQDMKIRWESSYEMLEKAWKLKKIIQKWIKAENNNQFQNLFIQNSEWKKIVKILKILQSFHTLTILIDIILQVSVHSVFQSFSWLFDRIEDIEKELKKNKKEKTELLQDLTAAKKKLKIYYEKTSDLYDYFFNFATILNSSIKLNLYKMSLFMNLSHWFITELFTDFF